MAEISSLPWIADPDDRLGMEWNIHIVQAASPDNRVCFMSNGPASEAHADFIVKACNNHDALMMALENARRDLLSLKSRSDTGSARDRRIEAAAARIAGALTLTSHKETAHEG